MTTMIAGVYDALWMPGPLDEKARKAAEAVAQFDARFERIERRLMVLTWQVGALVAI